MTSRGSDKLVVPEEKMADYEEQLSDEEKVKRPIPPATPTPVAAVRARDPVPHATRACPRGTRRLPAPRRWRKTRGRGAATAAAAPVIFSSTSALCDPPAKAPSTVLVPCTPFPLAAALLRGRVAPLRYRRHRVTELPPHQNTDGCPCSIAAGC